MPRGVGTSAENASEWLPLVRPVVITTPLEPNDSNANMHATDVAEIHCVISQPVDPICIRAVPSPWL